MFTYNEKHLSRIFSKIITEQLINLQVRIKICRGIEISKVKFCRFHYKYKCPQLFFYFMATLREFLKFSHRKLAL
jgi:hypothetical protein